MRYGTNEPLLTTISIMAESYRLRDLPAPLPLLRSFARKVLQQLPTPCPLCKQSALGGLLCGPCRDEVTASTRAAGPRCAVCRLWLNGLNSVSVLVGSSEYVMDCPDCALLQPEFDRVITAFDYVAPGNALIHQFKTARQFAHSRFLGQLLVEAALSATPPLPSNTILVPVPSSAEALIRRGFNPAAELARHVGSRTGLPVRGGLLRRVFNGLEQKNLSRAERANATRQLYACTRSVQGMHLTVVDDVMTTGSTLQAISRELKSQGAYAVTGLVLARTPYQGIN